jgi:hypothetical protein
VAVEGTGVTLPPGTDVQLLLHALHHHADHWGPDAHVWNPDRWLADRPGLQPHVFAPFLDGVRRCAGLYLAELEFAVLAYVLLGVFDTAVLGPWCSNAPCALERRTLPHAVKAERDGLPVLRVPADAAGTSASGSGGGGSGGGGGDAFYSPYRLRLAADMFTAIDGPLPFTIRRRGA